MSANTTTAARKTATPRSTKSTNAAPAPRVETVVTTEQQAQPEAGATHPYGYLLEKDPTALHLNYAKWVESEVGIKMTPEMIKVLQVVCVTRGAFQSSEANQKDLKARKEAWAKQQAEKKAAAAKAKVEQLKKLAKETGLDLSKLLADSKSA